MTVGQIMLGIALFAIAGAVLYVWGLKKSVNQREDLQRSLLSACGSRVVRRAKKQGGITRAEIAAMGNGGLCLGCESCRYPICPFGK